MSSRATGKYQVPSVFENSSRGLCSSTGAERERAWQSFHAEYFPQLFRTVCRFGIPAAEVEDVTQQVFFIAYRKLEEGLAVEHPKAWLRGIAVRVISDRHRWRRVRQVKAWLLESTSQAQRGAPASPAESAATNETQRRVGRVLEQMSPKLRSVLVLCDIEECSVSEAADALAIPVNTVRSRRRIARGTFQKLWTQAHGDDHG